MEKLQLEVESKASYRCSHNGRKFLIVDLRKAAPAQVKYYGMKDVFDLHDVTGELDPIGRYESLEDVKKAIVGLGG